MCAIEHAVGETHELEQRHRLAAECEFLIDGAPSLQQLSTESRIKLQVESHHDIVEDRQFPEQADALKRTGDPVARHVMGTETRQRRAAQFHTARGRLIQTDHDVDEGALAGAVWADEAMHRAGFDDEVDIAQGTDAAEALAQLAHHQHRLISRWFPGKVKPGGIGCRYFWC